MKHLVSLSASLRSDPYSCRSLYVRTFVSLCIFYDLAEWAFQCQAWCQRGSGTACLQRVVAGSVCTGHPTRWAQGEESQRGILGRGYRILSVAHENTPHTAKRTASKPKWQWKHEYSAQNSTLGSKTVGSTPAFTLALMSKILGVTQLVL